MKPGSDESRRTVRPSLWLAVVILLVAMALAFVSRRSHPAANHPVQALETNATREAAPFRPAGDSRDPLSSLPLAGSKPTADISDLIVRLRDSSLPLRTRREAARALCRIGSDEAMVALKQMLIDGPSALKAAIAEGLGECPHRDAPKLLAELLNNSDEVVARGAARGLALRDDNDPLEKLGNLLVDAESPLSVRTEVALALGEMHQPEATALLIRSLEKEKDSVVVENILAGLGKRPVAETGEFFKQFLAEENNSSAAKVAAIEALSSASGDVSDLLRQSLNDPDPSIRAAAAWALSTTELSDLGPELAQLLTREASSEVRLRLYQALENQAGADPQIILPQVRGEVDPLTRLAGLDYLSGQMKRNASAELVSFFEQTGFPELRINALTAKDAQLRLGSVIALSRAGTPASRSLLLELVQNATDRRVVLAAQSALAGTNRR